MVLARSIAPYNWPANANTQIHTNTRVFYRGKVFLDEMQWCWRDPPLLLTGRPPLYFTARINPPPVSETTTTPVSKTTETKNKLNYSTGARQGRTSTNTNTQIQTLNTQILASNGWPIHPHVSETTEKKKKKELQLSALAWDASKATNLPKIWWWILIMWGNVGKFSRLHQMIRWLKFSLSWMWQRSFKNNHSLYGFSNGNW